MTRFLAAGLLAVAALSSVPASAAPGGDCGQVDVACGFDPCHPEEGCVTRFCVVTVNKCLVQAEV